MRKFFIWIFFLSLTACNVTPVVVEQPPQSLALPIVPTGQIVFLLPAQVTYQRVDTEEPLPPPNLGEISREALLTSIVERALANKGLEVIALDKLSESQQIQIRAVIESLKEKRQILASSYKDKGEVVPLLQQLHILSGAHLVCVSTLLVKVGKAGYYIPQGSMWQGTSSSAFKVALVSLSTGEHLWRNEVYVRKLPNDRTVNDSMTLLLQLDPQVFSG